MNTHEQVRDFIHNFYRELDTPGHEAQVANAFDGQGEWMRQGKLLTGPQEVEAALRLRDAGRRSAHVVSNFQLEKRDDGEWVTRYYLSAYAAQADQPLQLLGIVDCSDQLRMRDGGLRIVRKTSRIVGG